DADGAIARAGDLVAVVAVDAVRGDAPGLADVKGIVGVGVAEGGGVTGGTDAGAGGMLGEEGPAGAVAVPVGAVVEVGEVAVGEGPGMAAGGPPGVDGGGAVAAVVPAGGVRRGIAPFIPGTVLLGQPPQPQRHG